MKKLLYISQGGANDAPGDFGIWPVDSFRGAALCAANDTSLGLYFNPMKHIEQGGSGLGVDLADITKTAGANSLTILKSICKAINHQRTRIVVVADDNASGTAEGQTKIDSLIDLGTAPAITYSS